VSVAPLEPPGLRPELVQGAGIVILTYYYPPMSVGPAFVLDALLAELDLGPSLILTGRPEKSTTPMDPTAIVRGNVVRFDVPRWWPERDVSVRIGRFRVPIRVRALGNILVSLRVATEAARAVHRPESKALLVVYPKQNFLLAGCIASLFTRKPLIVYFLDVFVEGLPHGRRVASLLEWFVAKRATIILGMSEPHRRHIERRLESHGATADVHEIPHPYAPAADGPPPATLPGRPAILFTGAIYDAQADGIRRVIDALASPVLSDLDPHLTLLTQTGPEELRRYGIGPTPRVTIATAAREDVRAAQRGADILLLPIGMSANAAVRRTAAPSKLPEYLAADRAILVHAPADAYIARYATDRGFAEVVTESDPEALAEAIHRITGDEQHVRRLREAAARTLERHLAANAAEKLRAAVASLAR
jgi:glycosyltransferase involved in cell wall biosynthesis